MYTVSFIYFKTLCVYEEPEINPTFNPQLFLQLMKKMLLLQYLVTILEGDFGPRNCAYQGRISLFPCDEFNKTMLYFSCSCRKYGLGHFEGVIAEHASGMPPKFLNFDF